MSNAPSIQHLADIEHTELTLPKHMLQRRLASENGPAILERNPAVGQRLFKVNIESFIYANHKRDSYQSVLAKPLFVRIVLPCMEG
jgi:hypothetical protein